MKKILILLMLSLAPVAAQAQHDVPLPTNLRIRTFELGDSTRFVITWTPVEGKPTYDVLTFTNPRNLLVEQFRIVTGNAWTITVPRSSLRDGMVIYTNVRASTPTIYAAITYRIPVPAWLIVFQLDTTGAN